MATLRARRYGLPVAGLLALVFLLVAAGAINTEAGAEQLASDRRPPGWSLDVPTPRSPSPNFVLDRGEFTGFDVPFGDAGGDGAGINNRGVIVAGYRDPQSGCVRGFSRDDRGRFTRIDHPRAGNGATQPARINDRGQIVGNYLPDSCSGTTPLRAFLRDERGRFTTIRFPDAAQTQAIGLNNRGQVVGDYLDRDGVFHGYVWDGRRFTTIDGPAGATGVTVLDINDRGQMVGAYLDAAGAIHGFQLSNRVYTTIDVPGVTYTLPWAINNRGQIAGFTAAAFPLTADSDAHGFVLRRGAGGPFTRFDFPGAVDGTVAWDINDAGTIVGSYGNPNTAGYPSTRTDSAGSAAISASVNRSVTHRLAE
jgi:uncharacterized membrane protein